MGVDSIIYDGELVDWLKAFFSYTERRRLGRGQTLYQEDAVIDFHLTEEGFKAHIHGSRFKPYLVKATFDDTLPNPADVQLDCSCPDSAEPCKHAICAVIHWVVVMDNQRSNKWNLKDINRLNSFSRRRTADAPGNITALGKLQGLASEGPPAADQFSDAVFWHVHPDLNDLMKGIYTVVKRDLERM
ncbi:SWIM zinc finger protein [Scopulibacillus darangshiensis]|uniref:SWIM zinc finger protein n=1 Tax=Scopulibacillus darangshiensis TaxID=442528 RepID=A0A4R2P2K6_9BACL|nr:SWIM zinc finger family protein [Scopulibacillus darangshiensis]TCP28920.1 SWIM zinc finger protein [Scopulibacillus darangshiensis]